MQRDIKLRLVLVLHARPQCNIKGIMKCSTKGSTKSTTKSSTKDRCVPFSDCLAAVSRWWAPKKALRLINKPLGPDSAKYRGVRCWAASTPLGGPAADLPVQGVWTQLGCSFQRSFGRCSGGRPGGRRTGGLEKEPNSEQPY